MTKRFEGLFTQQEPIPLEGIERAIAVMASGRLHRYNIAEGETPEVVHLEREFATYMGVEYCLACTSGGYALQTALRAFGVEHGEPVLTNAFTLSAVPGAIAALGARPVLVETTRDLTIDLDHLERALGSSGARVLLLSHMRGHIADMDRLIALTDAAGVAVIEDCAHTMGAAWRGTLSGNHGVAACFSTQTYKHINSGEGGFIVSNDAQLMARATILSGSYMLYGRHAMVPDDGVFQEVHLDTPNCSGRMDNLRAAVLRPQLAALDANVERWNERYRAVAGHLEGAPGLTLPRRPNEERFVGSSIQFLADGLDKDQIRALVSLCGERGVELKWFGEPQPVAFTSRHQSWRYVEPQALPATDAVLDVLLDMRIPLTFSVCDCEDIGEIIVECVRSIRTTDAKHDSGSRVSRSSEPDC
jgi:dTDP-4-amino-4,6-dideoxygalactose transaminase